MTVWCIAEGCREHYHREDDERYPMRMPANWVWTRQGLLCPAHAREHQRTLMPQ